MTRCIHCTRCIRFGQDIAGIQEMGATGRGENMEIGTFIEHSVDHELSGNIIDLCPVGALNSKPFRYSGRGWEMTQVPLISPHDGVGTQLYGHVLRGRLMRVVPRPCEEINETWIADRDRFSYEGVYSEDRLLAPQLRQVDGSWREVEWDAALSAAGQGLKAAAAEPGGVGLLAHPSSTLEELYLLARLAEGLGSANIDHRLRQRDFRDQAADALTPSLGLPIAEIDRLDALLVVGSNLRREATDPRAPRAQGRRCAARAVSFINPARFDYFFAVAHICALVAGRAGRGSGRGAARRARRCALAAGTRCAAGGRRAQVAASRDRRHAQERRAPCDLARRAGRARQPLQRIAGTGARAGGGDRRQSRRTRRRRQCGRGLPGRCGSAPRAPAAAARATPGRTARQMLEQPLPGYLLLNAEPWADAALPSALETLSRARCVVAVTPVCE